MKIAFIGLGNMGSQMASRLIASGHSVTVHDISAESAVPVIQLGAIWASSPAEAAATARVTFTSLPGPAEVKQVALGPHGIVEGAVRGSTYVDLSTNSPSLVRHIDSVFATKQVSVLDSPVSGGTKGAKDGRLQMMVGGDWEAFERARAILGVLGDKITYMGSVGTGMVAKLVHNAITAASRVVIAEGLTLGVKAGVRADALIAAIQGGAYGQGAVLRGLSDSVLRDRFDVGGFTLQLSAKDVTLALELAKEYSVPMPALGVTERSQAEALARGWGGLDGTVTFRIQEEKAGVKVRLDPIP
jgi:3-hydroxyisobutyrate dehydrogenase